MGDLVNLRQVKKRLARAQAASDAAANRVAHGRTKAEKAATQKKQNLAERVLDQAKIEKPPNP
jgi:hypothetical protein